jgi:Lon protease-like protein
MPIDNPDQEAPNLPSRLELPILAIRNTVIFPVLAFPINVGRDKSLFAVERALESGKLLGILAQRDAKNEDPSPDELYTTGTIVKILKSVKMPGNKLSVIIQGLARIKVRQWSQTHPYLRAEVDVFEEPQEHPADLEQKMVGMRELAQRIIDLSPQIPSEASFLVRSIENPGVLADIVSSNLSIGVEEKQDLLDTFDTLTLRYPDGPHNAETLMVDPVTRDLYIVTKEPDGHSGVFRKKAPHADGEEVTLERVADLDFGGAALPGGMTTTAGDFSPDGAWIVVRTYNATAWLWRRDRASTVDAAFATAGCPLSLPAERQAEAIAFDRDGQHLISTSEGAGQPINRVALARDAP